MMKNAIDILGECELFSPLIAVHSSECAHQTAIKNGFDFAQMLLPYTTVQINIKEPIGQQQIKHNLHLDIRELKRSGFLLSNTVFRFVLQESILTDQKDDGEQSLLLSTFYQTFLHWHEPAEHEFLRAYLACIFVVSTADADPLNKFAELEAEQHREQHGQPGNSTTTTAKRITPAYCVPSKWFFPNILKYYVLVHDNSLAELDPQRPNEIFPAICSKYGHTICHLVHLNSANPANPADERMPDPWEPLISKNERGLESGINLAKQSIYSGSKSLKHGSSESQNNLNVLTHSPAAHLPPVSSAPSLSPPSEVQPQPLLFTTSTAFNPPSASSTFYQPLPATGAYQQQIPQIVHSNMPPLSSPILPTSPSLTYAQIASGSNPINSLSTNFDEKGEDGPRSYGKWLSAEDRQRLRQMVEDFVRGALVPFVEKQIAEQSEILIKRGGNLAKSTFTSMRKWLQNAATNATTTIGGIQAQQQGQGQQPTAIGAESAESQSRRLADFAFLFGLYQYSNQIYQSLKKDFANDQAWLYHAGCLEMASISAFFSNWQQFADKIGSNPLAKPAIMTTLRKQYPQRYMDNAIHFYANVCKQPLLALRALMNGVLILAHLEQFTEAAQQLIRFNTSTTELALADLIEAVLLEHAARLFAQAGNRKRKTTFYLATAGTRMLKFATQQQQNQQQEMSTDSMRHCRRLSRRFYEEVLNSKLLTDKGWSWAEHYLICQYISCI